MPALVPCVVTYSDAFFWKKFETVGFKNESMVQHALMVGSTDPTKRGYSVGMFSPQHEFWIGGPLTLVNFGAGAIKVCAEVN
jgi:hypothetical protein